MAHSSDRTISVEQLFRSVRRHRWLALLTTGTVFALVVAAFVLLPREFGSQGEMVVRLGRANVGMNAPPGSDTSVSIQDTRETEVLSVQELIKSREVLGRVADKLGPEQILENSLELPLPASSWFVSDSSDGEFTSDEYERLRQREKAIARLESGLDVASEKRSAVISVYCTGPSPKLAQAIVQEIMTATQDVHMSIHSAERSRSHFDRILQKKEQALHDLLDRQRDFRTEHNVLSVVEARKTLNGVIDVLENEIVQTKINLDQSLARIAELEEQAKSTSQDVEIPTTGMERLSTEEANQLLMARKAEMARLLGQYNENHPRVQAIKKEIERIEENVGQLPTERIEKNKVRNPVFEQLQIALFNERSTAKSLEGRLKVSQAELDRAHKRLKELNELEVKAAEIQRQVDVAKQDYDVYATKRVEAGLIDDLDKESISDIVIHQPASLQLKKHSPQGSVMLPLGLALSLFCGLGAALFADRKNLLQPSTPEEIEEALDVPLLVTVPRVHSSRVHSGAGTS